MRVMVLAKASKGSDAGEMPSTELLAAMGNCNERIEHVPGSVERTANADTDVRRQGASPAVMGALERLDIELDHLHMAEVLGAAGYSTAMTGKWHLGQQNGTPPWERGFVRSLNSRYGEVYLTIP